jgi:hypothetical protein
VLTPETRQSLNEALTCAANEEFLIWGFMLKNDGEGEPYFEVFNSHQLSRAAIRKLTSQALDFLRAQNISTEEVEVEPIKPLIYEA